MARFLSAFLFALISLAAIPAAYAQEVFPMQQHDDEITMLISAEDWVTTKTAHVTVNVEAAVSGSNSGEMRSDMSKAVNELAKADWRLTGFDRSQDQTGLERWSTTFEARLPESELGGLGDAAKKLSKAGMQLTVGDIDFSPTLEEMEAERAALRLQIYKQVSDQLAAANAAFPGRNYRISSIEFANRGGTPMPPHVPRPMARAMMAANAALSPAPEPQERAEKVALTANVIFAAVPPEAKH